jgi:hypothetical protein
MRTALFEIYDNLFQYFSSTDWQQIFSTFEVISLIISFLLLVAIIFLIIKIRKDIKKQLSTIVESVADSDLPKKIMVERWESVLKKLEANDESSYKLAVIEADKIFDDLLKRMGYQGEDMGERLRQLTSSQIANLDEVWQAHKIRNRIVHEPDFQLKRSQAKRVVEIYQRALEDLEAV